MAPTLLSPDTSIFFAQTKQAVVGSEKNFPRSYENTVTQRNAPFLDTYNINYNINVLSEMMITGGVTFLFFFFYFHNKVYLVSKDL